MDLNVQLGMFTRIQTSLVNTQHSPHSQQHWPCTWSTSSLHWKRRFLTSRNDTWRCGSSDRRRGGEEESRMSIGKQEGKSPILTCLQKTSYKRSDVAKFHPMNHEFFFFFWNLRKGSFALKMDTFAAILSTQTGHSRKLPSKYTGAVVSLAIHFKCKS